MMIYELEYELKEEHVNALGGINPDEVLKMFETAAAEHADKLGVGYDAMADANLLWVVTQIRYDVISAAKPGKVTLRTWPAKPTRLGLERDCTVLDCDGNEIIKGGAVWFLIDAISRKMCVPEDVYPSDEFYPHRNYEKRARRLRETEGAMQMLSVVPDESYIDGNGHVNNTKYAKLARIAAGEYSKSVKSYQIDFLHEVMEGERIELFVDAAEDSVLAWGECGEKGKAFICKADFGA